MSPFTRRSLIVLLSPVPAQIVGTIFNIWYNISLIRPLLIGDQEARFWSVVTAYNTVVYPAAIFIWFRCFTPIHRVLRTVEEGKMPDEASVVAAQRRSIHLPWIGASVALTAWLLCIPVFLLALSWSSSPLHKLIVFHLVLSFLVAGLMAASQGAFTVELAVQRFLFPILFRDTFPGDLERIRLLTLKERGAMWTIAAIVCPIAALTLLAMVPNAMQRDPALIVYVGAVASAFGILSAVLIGRWIAAPIHELRKATAAVRSGDLSTRIALVRADEFGPMIREFNRMVEGLSERQKILETFGQHVGQRAAQKILQRDGELGGTERNVTVMFADIRGFTTFSEDRNAADVVATLNRFFSLMVDAIESNGGMVNKFLGDGLMALFGIDDDGQSHADNAIQAAVTMLDRLREFNSDVDHSLRIGVGVHTGVAVVGSIGSAKRLEYTAIGDTVNVASRIEGLTKKLDTALLLSESTAAELSDQWRRRMLSLSAQALSGRSETIEVFTLRGL